ncbi:hypothetical protein [Helicobacter pullorum]|uniref:hypothetical protein n=1 Tax=Helicobacter pullorum TaxID=35818 RepID=UPI00174CB999|nr:hypothetical protein [Helicobacter pullorum]
MNPQSPKVVESNLKLDSKTRQKLNSKSKQSKIQRVKTCDSKKPTKSKNSSKVKSLIRTIPVSVTLAMALSSQMAVADITAQKGGVIQIPDGVGSVVGDGTIINNQIMKGTSVSSSGSSGTILNATIINGTIVNGKSSVVTQGATSVNPAGTIINGWNLRDGGNGTLSNGTIVVGNSFSSKSMPISVLIGKAGDLLVDSGVTITGNGSNGAVSNGVVFVGQNAQAGIITNKGTITGANKNIAVGNSGIVDAIINEGLIDVAGNDNFGIMGWANSRITNITNTGTIMGNAAGRNGNALIGLRGNTVKTLNINGGVLNHTGNGNAIYLTQAANVGTIVR